MVLALSACIAAVPSAAIVVVESSPQFQIEGGLRPTKLPRHAMAPVTLLLGGEISNPQQLQPPALKEVTIDFDKNGTVDARGLPVCKLSRLAGGEEQLPVLCRKSIVGTGEALVEYRTPTQGSIKVPVLLRLFNGGTRGGTTTLFIQSFIPVGNPTPTIATVKVTRLPNGPYGLQAVTQIPPIADGSGSLLDFNLKIRRLFDYKGVKRSFAAARCLDGHLSAKLSTTFDTGDWIEGTLIRPCESQG
jgi:hypothetical protein